MKLTDRQIKNLKPKSQRYEIWEGNGFGIRVFPTGKKSWVYMYRFQGKTRRITFGSYPKLTVAAAHAIYGKSLTDLEKGIDPGADMVISNQENRLSPTIEELTHEYLEKWAKPRKRSWKKDESMLTRDVVPFLGKQKANQITRRDIVILLDKILERGSPIAANRTLAVIRRMFNFAVERDIMPSSPCHGFKSPAKENKRDRLLTTNEICSFWESLNNANMSELSKLALKLQLATAQRKGEVISAEWEEFDLTGDWWTIPAAKSKNGNLHQVPLSKLAIELLQEIKSHSTESKWLFPSANNSGHFIPEAINKAVSRNKEKFKDIKHFTPHDLRRTAASHMTAIGIPRLVVSKLLNHVENSVTAIYDRYSYDKEKRVAIDAWSTKLKEIILKNTG
jgi:integrase